MAPVRVLLVGPSLDIVGGQSVQLERLRHALAGNPAVSLRLEPVNPRLQGALAGLQRVRYVRTVITEAVYLARLLGAIRKSDVVHAYSASYWSFLLAPAPAIVLGRLFRKKVILNYHSGEAADHLARWGWHALPIIRLASLVVVQSEYLQGVFKRHGIQAGIVPNSLEVSRFPYRERCVPGARFFCNRNHEAHYGVDVVLRAFALVAAERPDATLVVAGSGPLTERLKSLATQLGLHDVEWIGKVDMDEMIRRYDAADVLLNGSSIDNMPLSILEAFACGLPVVSTAAGGIPLLVQPERTGLLAPVGDHTTLARQALRMLQEPQLALRLSQQARALCLAEYSDSGVAQRWAETYLALAPARDG